MRTAYEIRKDNLNMMAEKLGRNILAKKLGYKDTNYLNLLLSGHSNIGAANARRFEAALGQAEGWLDAEPKDKHPNGAMGVINDAMDKWTPEQKARFWQMVANMVGEFR